MTARPALNIDRSFWTVMHGTEFETVATRDEAQAAVDGWLEWKREPVVIEFNPSEGWSRNVSLDFLPDEDTDHDDEAEFREYRAHKAWERDVAPRVL